jgi:hypothetical protein
MANWKDSAKKPNDEVAWPAMSLGVRTSSRRIRYESYDTQVTKLSCQVLLTNCKELSIATR